MSAAFPLYDGSVDNASTSDGKGSHLAVHAGDARSLTHACRAAIHPHSQALVSSLLANVSIVGLNQLHDIEIDKVRGPSLSTLCKLFILAPYALSTNLSIPCSMPTSHAFPHMHSLTRISQSIETTGGLRAIRRRNPGPSPCPVPVSKVGTHAFEVQGDSC